MSLCLWFPPTTAARRAVKIEGDFHVDDIGAHRAPSVRTFPHASAADGRARLHLRRDGRSRAGLHPAGAAHGVESVERPDRRARQQHLYRLPVRRVVRRHARRPDRAPRGDDVGAGALLRGVHRQRDGRYAGRPSSLPASSPAWAPARRARSSRPISRSSSARRYRGSFTGALAGFFSFGFVAAALLGYFIVPAYENGWRIVLVITAVPVVMLLWWRRALPESPRWLESRGREKEAEAVLDRIEAGFARDGPCPAAAGRRSDGAGRQRPERCSPISRRCSPAARRASPS